MGQLTRRVLQAGSSKTLGAKPLREFIRTLLLLRVIPVKTGIQINLDSRFRGSDDYFSLPQ